MSHSIEDIWKKGFISDEALVAPKVNDLYNQKSKNIIDKFEVVFKWNLIGLLVFAAGVVIVLSVMDMPYLGVFIAAMLFVLVIRGRTELALLALLDKNVSSYEYVKSFDSWLKNQMIVYAKLYSFFYPALFLSIVLQFRFSALGHKAINGFLNQYPETPMLFSMPVYFLLAVTVIAGLLFYFSGPLYRLDFKSLYGRMFNKLQELISDMEALRR